MRFLLLQYLRNALVHRDVLDFIHSGIGIEERHRKYEIYWRPHLEACVSFQRENLTGIAGESVSVLGAGRCLDLDLPELLLQFEYVHLYDADPACSSKWKELKASTALGFKIQAHIGDLTGSIGKWTNELRSFLKQNSSFQENALASFFDDLSLGAAASVSSDVVISLNILGQIPIYWRDRVHDLLKRYWGLETDERGLYPGILQESLDRTFSKLQLGHLDLLACSGADRILLFTDKSYSYYKADSPDWQVEPALYTGEVSIHGYRIVSQRCWDWNLAPLAVAHKDYGEVHQVIAFCFTKTS